MPVKLEGQLAATPALAVAHRSRRLIEPRARGGRAARRRDPDEERRRTQKQTDRLRAARKAAARWVAQTRRIIVDLQARGLTLREVAAELERRHVPTQKGGAWSPGHIYKILAW